MTLSALKVPTAIVLSVFLSGVAWSYAVGSWKADFEARVVRTEERIDFNSERARVDHDLLQRIDERQKGMDQQLDRIERKLDAEIN